MRRLGRLLALPLIILATLSACATSDDDAGASPRPTATPTPFLGLPEGSAAGGESPAGVIASDEPGMVWLVTYGSSTNPAVAREVSAEGQTVTVEAAAEEGGPATMDYVPMTSAILIPEDVDLDQPITFDLGQWGTVTLDSTAPGTEAWVEQSE